LRKTIILLAAATLGITSGCGEGQHSVSSSPGIRSISTAEQGDSGKLADGVAVSRSLRFGQVNEAPYGSFSEKGQLGAFDKAIRSATKIEGILDVAQPDYDVVITEDGKRTEIHLWLRPDSKQGMYTYVSDTGTGYTLTETSTRRLCDLIWGLKYGADQAAANGDLVNAHGIVSNRDKWETFKSNVEAGIPAELQVVQYTIEGDPIFDNLSFDGKTIMHKHDTTHDAYGTPRTSFDFCRSIKENKKDNGTEYLLGSCGEGNGENGMFNLYLENP